MTSKEWRHHIRSLAPVSRPDDMEEALLKDFEAVEKRAAMYDSLLESWRKAYTTNTVDGSTPLA